MSEGNTCIAEPKARGALLHFRTPPPIIIDDSHEKTRLKALP